MGGDLGPERAAIVTHMLPGARRAFGVAQLGEEHDAEGEEKGVKY